jgi:hypothetical protein
MSSTTDTPGITGLIGNQQNQTTSLADQDNVTNLIGVLGSLQQPSIGHSLTLKGFTVSNFASNTVYADWKSRFPYFFSIQEVSYNNRSPVYSTVAVFRLPINPTDVTINAPFAIKTTVTSDGILEEHNGIPLKSIVLTGTTGTYITRPQNGKPGATGILNTLFGGTITAANSLISSLKSAQNAFAGDGTPSPGGAAPSTNAMDNTPNSGYYQYHMLRIFLETYALIKKSANGRKYRLAFHMIKDKQAYLVTPNVFQTRKSGASPMEYLYTIQMTAWAAIDLSKAVATTNITNTSNSLNDLQKALNTLQNARNILTGASNVISAVQADVQTNIFGPLNTVIGLTKQTLGIAKSLADLPNNLYKSFLGSVVSNWNSLVQTNTNLTQFNAKMQSIIAENSLVSSAQLFINNTSNPGGQDYYADSVFDDPDFTDSINVSALPTTAAQQNSLNNLDLQAASLTQQDLTNLAVNMQGLSDALAPSIENLDPTDENWDILYSLQDSIASLYSVVADGSLNTSAYAQNLGNSNTAQQTTALAFWTQSAATYQIPFNTYQGKFQVPFQFKATLEQLALTYLNDATLWNDIAALNGLQAPYVDEVGFTYSFLANGSAYTFNINSNTNLYVGQTIYVSSNTQIPVQCVIQAINVLSSTNFQIVVNNANMGNFLFADDAQMKAYLPYTVNSLKKIYIPTNQLPQDTSNENQQQITFIDEDLELVNFAKIDLLLDSNFDLAITPDGFANLAYGTTNLVQAATLKMATIAGSQILDPNYGASVAPGTSVADLDFDSIIASINNSFASDPRFNTPSSIDFDINGPTLSATVVTSTKQSSNGILPITIPLTQ